MKIKILIWGFCGVKYLNKSKESPTKDDFIFAKITETDKRYICAREFNLHNNIIKITDNLKWGNITFFIFDNYKCLIENKDYKEIK